MEKEQHDLATLIYLAIEVECDCCHKRFSQPDDSVGKSEAEIWSWAEKAAADAYSTGWRDAGGRQLCRECFSSYAQPSA